MPVGRKEGGANVSVLPQGLLRETERSRSLEPTFPSWEAGVTFVEANTDILLSGAAKDADWDWETQGC